MSQMATGSRKLQCDLRTALGPGTQYVGVTEAILRLVTCGRESPSTPRQIRYCDSPNARLDRSRRLLT